MEAPLGRKRPRGAGQDAHVWGRRLASLSLPGRRLEDGAEALLERSRHPVYLLEKEGASLREIELAELRPRRIQRARGHD